MPMKGRPVEMIGWAGIDPDVHTNKQSEHHRVYRDANPDDVQVCVFCGDDVYLQWDHWTLRYVGKGRWFGVIHHVDEDKTNNNPENLVAAHGGCHTSYHRRGKHGSRRKCPPGCTCGRHRTGGNPCPPGCRCKRHGCPPSCTCGKHQGKVGFSGF
jgi:hypothetical protein